MMQFLRKYQRYIFIVITAFIVISFSFFGTFSLQWGSQKKKEIKVAERLDGSELTYSSVEKMSRFLSSDSESLRNTRERFMPNLFNDGVIEKDFLESKIISHLVAHYFEDLKPHLQFMLDRVQHYIPYKHPETDALSSMMVWNQLAPSISQGLLDLRKEKEVSLAFFSRLFDLYLAEKSFPPEALQRVLIYQQNQNPSLPVDMRLVQEDFSLFSLHTISDWFGQNFIDMISQFILNAASVAKEKGYQVSEREAIFELKENLKKGLKKWGLEMKEGDFRQHLQMLGMSEEDTIETYRQILLFRRYFHDMGGHVFLDAQPYKEIAAFAAESALVQLFDLPPYLQLKNFHDLMLLEVYLQAVYPHNKNPLELRGDGDPIESVEKRAPDLVGKNYQIRLRETTKERVLLRIGERELWEWEMKEPFFKELKEKFPFLAHVQAATAQKRFEALENLTWEKREEVDRFARDRILEGHPTWIQESLVASSQKEMNLDLRLGKSQIVLKGVQSPEKLFPILEKAPLLSQESLTSEEKKAIEALKFFTQDKEHYYSIELVGRDKEKHILLFGEALKDGTLEHMLDSFLEKHYDEAKGRRPDLFGLQKPFDEVKDQIGKIVFVDLLKSIDQDYSKQIGKITWEEGNGSLDFYAKHRLFCHVRKLREKIMNQKDPSLFLQKNENSLADQWKMKEKTLDVDRTFDPSWVSSQLFKKKKVDWSSVHVESSGSIAFFHVLEWKQKPAAFEEDLLLNQKKLSFEAQGYLTKKLLKRMQEKRAIVLPIRKED